MSASKPPPIWRTPIHKANVFSSSPSKASPLSASIVPRTPYASPYKTDDPIYIAISESSALRQRPITPLRETPRSRTAPSTLARQTLVSAPKPKPSCTVQTQRYPHTGHNETFGPPGEQIVLKSMDGQKFWVRREVFDKYCGFLDLHPSLPNHKLRLPSSSSSSIQLLLELLHTHRSRWSPHLSQTSLEDLIALYDLCQAVEADPIASTVKDEVGRRAEEDPWRVIGFASGLRDVELGRKGIRGLRGGSGERLWRGGWKAEDFADIEPGWFIELLRLKEKQSISITPSNPYRSPSTAKSPLTPTRRIVSTASPVRSVSRSCRSPVGNGEKVRYSPLRSNFRGFQKAGAGEVIDWLAVAREFDS